MHIKTFLAALFVSVFATVGANAQTIGMAGTNRGFTSQASAALASVISANTDINMVAQTFGGSSIYVPQVSGGEIAFGLANELETTFAVTGTGIYNDRPQPGLQIAAVLTPFRVSVFTRADSDIQTLADLRGKRVPGEWSSQRIIKVLMDGELANAGLSYDDVEVVPVANVVAGADEFAAGNADVFFFVFGAGKVSETDAKVGGIRVVGIDPSAAAVERMRKHVPPAYAFEVTPGPRSVGVTGPTSVMAYDYLVLTNGTVDDDTVYAVVKAIHDNPGALGEAFPALRLFNPDGMTKNFPGVSYHAGAERFYREVNQWPPQ
ncbi:MAG: TAXI family TRAP transporter solute-binding subunit [Alphaproteobacteria bacterium]|nr:TAXI family TRAP transporter solute-binding subunit [Alphaproteobacteria bacterium]